MDEFEPVIVWAALATRVLVVAKTRIEGTWAAYIDAVPGVRHSAEIGKVLSDGTKLSESIAREIFVYNRTLANLPYAQ